MAAQTVNNQQQKKMQGYFKGVKAELKKVSWPSKKELLNHTGVVVGVCALLGGLVWLLDTGLHWLLSLILGQ